MNAFFEQFQTELAEYESRCGSVRSQSIMELLWYCYSASEPIDDGRIREADRRLAPVFDQLSFNASEGLFDLISDLCAAYQRAAFLEGIQIGFHLSEELEKA